MKARAAFLDRDGVLIVDKGYPHRPEDLVFIDGAAAAVRRLRHAGFKIVVVTNQSGVARGLFTLAEMDAFHTLMRETLAAAGADIDAIYACPYLPDAPVAEFSHPDHPDRKPNPGMILRAIADLDLDPDRSILIGDKDSDMEAARRAGVAGAKFRGGDLDAFVAMLAM
ncbi:MAG TPA: HAD family hydrolase [Caulobacteraceae bacterium]|jgi:D-glycero-D-manno-heptose 1,7-bisphosphate phosphatase